MYRSREWEREGRNKKKQDTKGNWYKTNKNPNEEYTSVLFVPVTKGGVLAKELRNREAEINKFNNERITIV